MIKRLTVSVSHLTHNRLVKGIQPPTSSILIQRCQLAIPLFPLRHRSFRHGFVTQGNVSYNKHTAIRWCGVSWLFLKLQRACGRVVWFGDGVNVVGCHRGISDIYMQCYINSWLISCTRLEEKRLKEIGKRQHYSRNYLGGGAVVYVNMFIYIFLFIFFFFVGVWHA